MRIVISLAHQTLTLLDASGAVVARYPVSTAKRGAGEQRGSYQTPRGEHRIRAKIGAGAARGAVFKARRLTGEICTPAAYAADPDRDWILTRILWLAGCEPGRNRFGAGDTPGRYIYIHGTPDAVPLGVPASHGCVRMHSDDLITLFEGVPVGTAVTLTEN